MLRILFSVMLIGSLLWGTGCRTTARRAAPIVVPPVAAPSPLQVTPVVPVPPVPHPAPGTNQTVALPGPRLAPLVAVPVYYPLAQWVCVTNWVRTNGLGRTVALTHNGIRAVQIVSPMGNLLLAAGSRVVRHEGVEVALGCAPQWHQGYLHVHPVDASRTLRPLLQPPAEILHTNRLLVLDPGHGGSNPGTRSCLNSRLEKEFTLDWAMRARPLLEANGWQVVLTRTNDSDLSLTGRVAVADFQQADLFVSLHFNAVAQPEPSGVETYCLTPAGLASTITRKYEDNASLMLPGNRFDPQNLHYAAKLHRSLVRQTGAVDRGIKRARFMDVLVTQQRPALLLEGGYLSNPSEARRIGDPAYRQKLAEALARALP